MIRVKIAGTGSYLPERVVTNDELAEVGTRSRYLNPNHQKTRYILKFHYGRLARWNKRAVSIASIIRVSTALVKRENPPPFLKRYFFANAFVRSKNFVVRLGVDSPRSSYRPFDAQTLTITTISPIPRFLQDAPIIRPEPFADRQRFSSVASGSTTNASRTVAKNSSSVATRAILSRKLRPPGRPLE